ncbi:hypothetical protein FB567DRAFT_534875 [Paraphoma chrysanthemicola]|uniref:Uncharacterized protein n=1 Tax=Paraphoma chrysanthemicola TaxID=798071 RepID=A0A8K0R015_9PLEO|nr:hypothetical protein FB567DRAFT_534875 [Paraphoma chrysanthemicola]
MAAPNTAAGANLPPRPSNPPRPNHPTRSNIPNRPNAPNRPKAANHATMPRRPNVPSHPNLPGKKARNRSLQKSLSYTSRLRSAGPMSSDPDTERIRARLTTSGTAAEIVEEAYRVCRLNTSLRRDLDEATDQLFSPMSKDDDSARIKNRLGDGATVKQVAEEAYRVCRINAYLRKNKDEVQAELRVLKKRSAITEDVLQELRPEAAATRKVLDRAWKLIASRKIKIPDDLAAAYAALNAKDEYDWQPRKGAKASKRLTKQEEDEKRRELQRKKSGKKDKGKAKEPEEIKFLLHTHEGKTYDLRVPLADQDEIDDEDEEDTKSIRSEPGDTADGVAIADNVAAGKKRKNNSTPDQKSKMPKIDTDHDLKDKEPISPDIPLAPPKPTNPFATIKCKDQPAMGALPKKAKLDVSESMSSDPDFWKSKIHLSATECWEEGIKLSAPPFPFKQSWDPASEGMQERATKVEDEDADFEEGEIKE